MEINCVPFRCARFLVSRSHNVVLHGWKCIIDAFFVSRTILVKYLETSSLKMNWKAQSLCSSGTSCAIQSFLNFCFTVGSRSPSYGTLYCSWSDWGTPETWRLPIPFAILFPPILVRVFCVCDMVTLSPSPCVRREVNLPWIDSSFSRPHSTSLFSRWSRILRLAPFLNFFRLSTVISSQNFDSNAFSTVFQS